SQKLTGGFNAQVGLSKSLKVYPGDKIEIQAFAKYLSSSQTTNLAGFASALTQAFGLSATSTGEAAKAFQSINEYGGFIATGNGEGNSNHPKAFINILVYDKDFNFLDLAFDQVQGGEQIPNGANTPHDELNINYEVKKEGYIFFFLSYEDTRSFEVYFDDVNIKHKETRIIQYNEYYAHGMLNANSWIRTANSNKNLFNAGTELNATTNWYDTPMRGLDPVLGRFMQLDALAELSPSLTPYRFGFNNPMSFNDPTGAYENNYGLIGDVGNYVGRGHDKEGDAGLARYFGNYNEERMIRNEAMNVGGGGTTMSVSEFLVEMWTGKNKGGSWKNGKGKIYDNVKDAKNNFRDNLGINVWAAERKKRKLIILIDEILFGEKLQEFDKKLKAQKRVEAALMVIENYRANGTKYSQEKRQFGCDVDYADCSSTFTTIIGQAGQENIFKGKRTADMRDEIASKPTNNKYRFNDPLPGDVMMWGKHVAMVTDVIDGKVYFATMGLSGASIAKVKLDESCSLLTENKWGGGGFLGFWTPD
ncbi:MAG: hypothetical protein O9340_02585, partial [Cyclobacteriaceae bacterium]|nr:hypothetical protein [Cyclobacteriaceae bacterium]